MLIHRDNVLSLFVKEPAILFNDVPVAGKFVTEANDEAGYIVVAKTNEQGEIYCVGDEIAMERLEGKVEFRGMRRS